MIWEVVNMSQIFYKLSDKVQKKKYGTWDGNILLLFKKKQFL